MNTIYNSQHFCVIEFPSSSEGGDRAAGGFEIMDKHMRREIFLGGKDAEQFRLSVQKLISSEPSADDVDDFLAGYSGLMTTPLTLH
ncbi:MAG: DUF3567 domain-containing protein [Gemmatimonadota bacterium]